jgi:hypothetical protein
MFVSELNKTDMNTLQNTYNWLSGFICEPTTAITDFMLSFFCLWCYKNIKKQSGKKEFKTLWANFFLFVACSTFFGGINHSVTCLADTTYHVVAWIGMQLFSCLALFFAQKAVFNSELKNENLKNRLNVFALIQLICFGIIGILMMSITAVSLNSLIGLLQLLIICFPRNSEKIAYRSLVCGGFIISFLTIYISHNKISFAYWFNYNDIAHVIIFMSLLLIYKGILNQTRSQFILKTI